MPIHDLGYRSWQGEKSHNAMRWFVIAYSGVRIVWKNLWLRRLIVVAWLPAMYAGWVFFLYEQLLEVGADQVGPLIFGMISWLPDAQVVAEAISDDPEAARHTVWAWVLMQFLRYSQGMLMLLVVGMIAPPLIAKDVRSRAFLLYFSRPLSPVEYLIGKASIVWCYLMLITTLPALTLYVVGVMLSPSVSVVLDTWDLPLRILIASVIMTVPTTALALLFSSLTSETRVAGFAWFALWALGGVAYVFIWLTHLTPSNLAPSNNLPQPIEMDEHWCAVSLYHTLGSVQKWIFEIEAQSSVHLMSAAILLGLTVFSVVVLLRRVSAPIRI